MITLPNNPPSMVSLVGRNFHKRTGWSAPSTRNGPSTDLAPGGEAKRHRTIRHLMLSWSELLFAAAIFSTKSCRGQTKHKALLGRRSWNSSSFAQRIIRNQTKPAMRLIRPTKGAAIDAAWSLAMLRTVFVSMWSRRNTKDHSQYPTSSTKCIGPVDGRSKSTF